MVSNVTTLESHQTSVNIQISLHPHQHLLVCLFGFSHLSKYEVVHLFLILIIYCFKTMVFGMFFQVMIHVS
jgi:hypothetical protein